MASKPGGYSGGDRGAMGSHTGQNSASGTGFGKADGGFSKGMTGATARRTPVASPSYPATLENLGKLFSRSMPGAGMIMGAGLDIAGARPGFSGYQGQVNTPGSYDPKGGPNAGASPGGLMGYPAGYPADRMRQLQGLMPVQQAAAPVANPGLLFKPQTYQPQEINIPGGGSYSQKFDPWRYFQ